MSEKTSNPAGGASEKRGPRKINDFAGRGGATERADFWPFWPEEAERSLGRRGQKSKFRQESSQERMNRSKLRMEKRWDKLEEARDKLANQKPPKRPGPVKRVGRTAGRGVHGFVHGKLFEVEQENVGTEGAHRSELAGEVVAGKTARFVKKRVRTHPARAAARAESQYIKAQADYQAQAQAETAVPEAGAGNGQAERQGRRKDGGQRRQGRGPLCQAASCWGLAPDRLCPAPGGDAVLYVLPGDGGQRDGGRRGGQHLSM